MNTEYIERKFRHIEFLFQDFFGCSGTDPNFEGFCSNLNGFVKHQDVFRRQEAMLKEVGDGGGVPRSTVYIYTYPIKNRSFRKILKGSISRE